MTAPRLLVAVADEALARRLAEVLADFSPELSEAPLSTVLQLLERLSELRLLILAETSVGDHDTLDLVRAARALRDDVAVIVLSQNPTIEHASEAIRRGAEDFMPVPFSEDLLRKEVARVLEAAELRDRVKSLRQLVSDAYGFEGIVSDSPRMRRVFEIAQAATRSETPVLLTGETGTGKELFARAIHANGRRAGRPFVAVNCAALPHDLVESELFGHKRGAFSGADRDSAGLFAGAHGGTLFLDEIGDLKEESQAKLLRALQDGEIRPVGGLESRHVDVRIIAATNRSLRELRNGVLRQDLFFRLSVLILDLPPLRERPDDIPRLIAHVLTRIRSRGITRVEGVEDEALELLLRYAFPGNVRELENLLEGISAMLPTDRRLVSASDVRGWFHRRGLSARLPPSDGRDAPSLNLGDLEAWAIEEALRRCHGNKSRAAQLLGISRDTLYRKLQDSAVASSESRTQSRKD